MICANCGAPQVRTRDTRTFRDPTMNVYFVERKRVCPQCEIQFKTIELPIEIYASMCSPSDPNTSG